MDFSVVFTVDADRANLVVTGELDAFTALQVRRCVEDALARGCQTFTVDVTGVTFVDAAGLGVFVGVRNVARRRGGTVTVLGASPSFERLCRLTGLTKVFRLAAPAQHVDHQMA